MKRAVYYYENIMRNLGKAKDKDKFVKELAMQLAMSRRNMEILQETMSIIREQTQSKNISEFDFYQEVAK